MSGIKRSKSLSKKIMTSKALQEMRRTMIGHRKSSKRHGNREEIQDYRNYSNRRLDPICSLGIPSVSSIFGILFEVYLHSRTASGSSYNSDPLCFCFDSDWNLTKSGKNTIWTNKSKNLGLGRRRCQSQKTRDSSLSAKIRA